MAVAKAQARTGVQGIHIWLIVFVALWLTSTVLLVLLYTDQKDLEQRNTELAADVGKLISGAEKTALPYYPQAGPNRTALGLSEAARAATAQHATGKPEDAPDVVKTKAAELGGRIAADAIVPDAQVFQQTSLLESLTSLYSAFQAEHTKLTQALNQNADLTAQSEKLAEANAAQKAEFDAKIAGFQQDLDMLRTETAEYHKLRDAEVDGMTAKLAALDQRSSGDIQKQRTENKEIAARFEELQNRYKDLTERLGELQIKPEEHITARQPDGRVLTAKPGDDVVYIDLGRNGGLVLGLKFAVYARSAGIPADGRAKARIEVVNIFDTSAECRIVELHGRDPILEGDVVANPIFDRERSLQFMVLGRFDVDGDGSPDSEGAEQIESLIRNWGGTVTTELSARVDFVVIGEAPPKPVLTGDATPEAVARQEAAQKAHDEYQDMLRAAQALSIPVLTQNVFMHFLGYR